MSQHCRLHFGDAVTTLERQSNSSGRAAVAAPAFPSKAELEAELAAEQAAAAAANTGLSQASIRRGSTTNIDNESSHAGNNASTSEEPGPSELTLVAYSAFMGLSSLLFGGLTLLQARQGASEDTLDPAKPMTVRDIFLQGLHTVLSRTRANLVAFLATLTNVDPQTLITGILVLSIVFIIAHTTRPSDQSFRSYWTDLQIQEHLRRIRERPLPAAEDVQATGTESPTASDSRGSKCRKVDRSSDSIGWDPDERQTQHAATFTNRISVSVRTPPYVRYDYFLFSLIMVKHPSTLCTRPSGPARRSNETTDGSVSNHDPLRHLSKASWCIGVFGHWFSGARDVYDNSSPVSDTRRSPSVDQGPLQYGVLDMHAEQKSNRRQSVTQRSVNACGSSQPDETAQTANFISKITRRKKNTNRLRPSQISAVANRSAAQRKTNEETATKAKDASEIPAVTSDASLSRAIAAHEKVQPATSTAIDTAANAASLAAIDATIKEYEAQLATLKSATDSSQEQLQSQLDDMRKRKREDDTARSDIKGRTKGLDEGKRHAEAARRDAEKRLKAAEGLRDAAQQRTDASHKALGSFSGRKDASTKWVQNTLEEGKVQRQTLKEEQGEDESAMKEAEATLAEIQAHIQRLENQVILEQGNLEAAQEEMQERITTRARQAASMPAYPVHQPGIVPNAQGFYVMEGEPYPVQDAWQGHYPDAADMGYFDNRFGGSRRPSVDYQSAAMMYGHEGQPGTGFMHSNATGLSDVRAQTPRQPRSLHDISSAYSESHRRSSIPPTSPFSMDLLPSNLFQTLDDDAQSSVLAGSETDRIEAALNQFGLDTSDQSDVEGTQSDRDTVDSEAQPGAVSEHGSESEGSTSKSRRSWWGSKTRQASKDRPAEEALSSSAGSEAESGDGTGKRRSFGVWPKLSLNQLNPGAKAFRSSSRKQADAEALRGRRPEGYSSQGYLGPVGRSGEWSGMEPRALTNQYDVVRRAFEASNGEEEGRRSWSAFDAWTQRQGLNNHPGMLFNESNRSSSNLNQTGASRLGQESFTEWPEDVFQPLNRTISADAGTSKSTSGAGDSVGIGDGEGASSTSLGASQGSRQTNRSRFAFWNSNSKTSVNSATSAGSTAASDAQAQSQALGSVPVNTAGTIPATPDISSQQDTTPNLTLSSSADTGTGATQYGSSPASSTASKPKKSFRWTRKRESTANSSNSTKDTSVVGGGGAGGQLSAASVQESSDASGGGAGESAGDTTSAASSP